MCFDPGDGQGMMLAHVVEKLTNALNERFVAVGLNQVVPKETHAVHTVDRGGVPGACFLESPESHFKAW